MTSFEGVYGPYSITAEDEREVLGYRLALFIAAVAQAAPKAPAAEPEAPAADEEPTEA